MQSTANQNIDMNQLYMLYYSALYGGSNALSQTQYAPQVTTPIIAQQPALRVGSQHLPSAVSQSQSLNAFPDQIQIPQQQSIPPLPPGVSNLAVWVGNLPPECTEDELRVLLYIFYLEIFCIEISSSLGALFNLWCGE
jgi:hypothetical protein